LPNRFHVAAIAFLRAKQLLAGARPRVDSRGHKLVTLALLEVLADTISWHVESIAVAPQQAPEDTREALPLVR
jgi:DNA-directed RNA polymerase subunit K/omega